MIKEIVARATLKRPGTLINSGFIYIKDNILEGIFTLDYLKISVLYNKPIAHLSEKNYSLKGCGFGIVEVKVKVTETIFCSKSNRANLYYPNIFYLYSESGEELILSIYESVEFYEIPTILQELDKIRF